MGNVADKSKGYYGVTGEDISYENADDFLVVTLTPARKVHSPEERSTPTKSPFDGPSLATVSTRTEVRRTGLEESIDSGYAEVQAAARKISTNPEPIPSKENVSTVESFGC